MVRDGKEHQKDADFVNGEAPDQPLTGRHTPPALCRLALPEVHYVQAGIVRRDCRRPISLIKLQALTAAEALRHEVRKAAWLRSDARRHLS
jgi:hypothetical protein